MVLKYICVCVALFVLGGIQFTDSTPVRERHVLNKIPIVISKSKSGYQREGRGQQSNSVAQGTRSSQRKPATSDDDDDDQLYIPEKARSGKSQFKSKGRQGNAKNNEGEKDLEPMGQGNDEKEVQNDEKDQKPLGQGDKDENEAQNDEKDQNTLGQGNKDENEAQNDEKDQKTLGQGNKDENEAQNDEKDQKTLGQGNKDENEAQNDEKDQKSLGQGNNDENEAQNDEKDQNLGKPVISKEEDGEAAKLNRNKMGDKNNKADNYALKDKSFKKYHVEKISYTQENIASSWPLGIIPYHFDTSSFDHILASRVREAMDFLESASCVQFKAVVVKPALNFTWIHITNPDKQRECSHHISHKRNGEITLILGLDCLKRRDILHSLLHAMGFKDEVAHAHRDQYIRIMWENIQPKYQKLFSVISENKQVMVEYDPMSIMHFHDRAFSRNGHATIVPMMPGLQIQPSEKLSQLDKMKLRLAFGHECNRRTVDDLLDTCKNVLHEELESKEKDTPETVNETETKNDDEGEEAKKNGEGEDKKYGAEDEEKKDKEGEGAKADDDGKGGLGAPAVTIENGEEVSNSEVESTQAGDAEPTEAPEAEAEPTEAVAMIL